MEPAAFNWISESFFKWTKLIFESDSEASEHEDAALQAYLDALQETRFFLRGIGRDNPEELKNQQRNLSDLWLSAAKLVSDLNSELAERCFAKAEYWSDPSGWRDDDREDMDILIESMERTARELMRRGTGQNR